MARVEVKRKRGETFDAMLRRFNRRVQLSGSISHAKRIRFHASKRNKTELKNSALRRIELQRNFEKLRRIGKLPEEKVRRRR